MKYENYSNLLGIPYVEGQDDCYGLVQRFFQQTSDLELANYARPGDFAYSGIDLITDNFMAEGFQIIDDSLDRLKIGDVLLMRLGDAPRINHIAIYVGNNTIIHHLYNQPSREDNFSQVWRRRTAMVIRHPEFKSSIPVPKVNFIDLLPPHVKAAAS